MPGVFKAGPGPPYRLGDGIDSFILTDDALVQHLFHVEQAARLVVGQLYHRNPGPHADHLGDVFLLDHHILLLLLAAPLLFQLLYLLADLHFLLAQLCR